MQEQEAQTLFPAENRAPLFPTCCFFYLLNIANSSWGVSFLQRYWACWSSYWLKCHILSYSEQPSPAPWARSSRQAHPNKAEICSWTGHLWLPCEAMESQSILLTESTVIHLFLKEMPKTEQMNGIINPLISPCCLGSPEWQLTLLCKYLKWVDPNPTQPSPALVLLVHLLWWCSSPCTLQCTDLQLDWRIPQHRQSQTQAAETFHPWATTDSPCVPPKPQFHTWARATALCELGLHHPGCLPDRAPHRLYKVLMTKEPGLAEHVQYGKS